MKKEIWKDIIGYEGLYMVSNYGRVKSLERINNYGRIVKEKILKTRIDSKGHLRVGLSKNGKVIDYSVHRLVAMHFIPNPECKTDVHHIDHNKLNNNVDNLVWVTCKEHKELHPEIFNKLSKVCSKKITQYDLDGNYIRTWSSLSEIQRELGYAPSNISKCCNGKPHYKTAYGYIWKYAED